MHKSWIFDWPCFGIINMFSWNFIYQVKNKGMERNFFLLILTKFRSLNICQVYIVERTSSQRYRKKMTTRVWLAHIARIYIIEERDIIPTLENVLPKWLTILS